MRTVLCIIMAVQCKKHMQDREVIIGQKEQFLGVVSCCKYFINFMKKNNDLLLRRKWSLCAYREKFEKKKISQGQQITFSKELVTLFPFLVYKNISSQLVILPLYEGQPGFLDEYNFHVFILLHDVPSSFPAFLRKRVCISQKKNKMYSLCFLLNI